MASLQQINRIGRSLRRDPSLYLSMPYVPKSVRRLAGQLVRNDQVIGAVDPGALQAALAQLSATAPAQRSAFAASLPPDVADALAALAWNSLIATSGKLPPAPPPVMTTVAPGQMPMMRPTASAPSRTTDDWNDLMDEVAPQQLVGYRR
jgi:hypothetical protein